MHVLEGRKMKGYFDRVEDGNQAVILFEKEKKQLTIPLSQLPEGCKPGCWLLVEEKKGEIVKVTIDEETTQEKQALRESLMEKLQRKKNSKFLK